MVKYDLMNYCTGERIREATPREWKESKDAAKRDGGVGGIIVIINGYETTCYVEEC